MKNKSHNFDGEMTIFISIYRKSIVWIFSVNLKYVHGFLRVSLNETPPVRIERQVSIWQRCLNQNDRNQIDHIYNQKIRKKIGGCHIVIAENDGSRTFLIIKLLEFKFCTNRNSLDNEMVLEGLVRKLIKTLKGRARRTKSLNDSITVITVKIAELSSATQDLLVRAIDLDSSKSRNEKIKIIKPHVVVSMMEDSYSSLKNLQEIEKFTNVIEILDSFLVQYRAVLGHLLLTIDKVTELQTLVDELDKHSESVTTYCANEIEKMNHDKESEPSKSLPISYQLCSLCNSFEEGDSRWLLWDKFSKFVTTTKNSLLRLGWITIGDDCYLSREFGEEFVKKSIRIIPDENFIECYQVIGRCDPFKIRQPTLEHIPEKYYRQIVTDDDIWSQKMVADAISGDQYAQQKLAKELQKESGKESEKALQEEYRNGSKHWSDESKQK
jgi:hypothetical protein